MIGSPSNPSDSANSAPGREASQPPPGTTVRPPRRGLLAGMRIRKKLIFLHTFFSLGLAAALLVALRPAIDEVVARAEAKQARLLLRSLLSRLGEGPLPERVFSHGIGPHAESADVELRTGQAVDLLIPPAIAERARAVPGEVVEVPAPGRATRVIAYAAGADGQGAFYEMTARIPESRRAVGQLYLLLTIALLAVYALVAVSLEVFVLPQHVYAPIRRLLAADRAVQEGRRDEETIPDAAIPADELGEIMRSRNASIAAIRTHEQDLADALARLEEVATDLARKNHLLEAAQRNLADADRLASLGMMSAGIAHELNTPLAVLKGLVERLNADPARGIDASSAALMLRVVGRLERLSESLLDFARARPARTTRAAVRTLVDEAATLVRLDRGTPAVQLTNSIEPALVIECDPDRLVQVFVNLVRNAVDAVRSNGAGRRPGPSPSPKEAQGGALRSGRVTVAAQRVTREGRSWASITITDDGPGIDPSVLPRLFQPFASTRLDSRGTGLGLAVAEGIVRAHGGIILARNRADSPGAIFEVLLPQTAAPAASTSQPVSS